jgi:hypothetical protein
MVAGTADMVRRCTDVATDRINNDEDNLVPNIIQIKYVSSLRCEVI